MSSQIVQCFAKSHPNITQWGSADSRKVRLQGTVVYWEHSQSRPLGNQELSSKRTAISNLAICPLPFWQTYESVGALMSSMIENEASYPEWWANSHTLQVLARYFALPLYYHLITSGYGAFVEEELVGWLYLRGWKQMLYIDALSSHPAWDKQDIPGTLLEFAEQQARDLRRPWIGLTATSKNDSALRLYEEQRYQRAHWRIMQLNGGKKIRYEPRRKAELHPIFGPSANQAYRRFSLLDLKAGDDWVAPILTQLLDFDVHRWPGKEWLVSVDGQTVAYLNQHGSHANPNLYLACDPAWWGNPHILHALGAVLNSDASQAKMITLRLASSGHHDAALPLLSEMGFTTHPAILFKMFKRLENHMDNTPQSGGEAKL